MWNRFLITRLTKHTQTGQEKLGPKGRLKVTCLSNGVATGDDLIGLKDS